MQVINDEIQFLFFMAMFIDTVVSFDAKFDVVQVSFDAKDAQVTVQLHCVIGDLLAEGNVDSNASISQRISRCLSLDRQLCCMESCVPWLRTWPCC